jgi:serine/threonine protein kinase
MHEAVVLPSRRGSRLGPAGDEVLLKLLARFPAHRYARAEDVLRALDLLEAFLRTQGPEVRPPAAPLLHDASLARFTGAESVVGFDASAASLMPHPQDTLAPAPAPQPPALEQPKQITATAVYDIREKEQRLDEVILTYLNALDAGQPIDRQALLDRYPDLAPELLAFFAGLDDPLVPPLRDLRRSRLGASWWATLVASWWATLVRPLRDLLCKYGRKRLGQGGMGPVYKAEDMRLGRPVACKLVVRTTEEPSAPEPAIRPPALEQPKQIAAVGDYDILEILGQGGMGIVYKARDRRLDRVVALKVLRSTQGTAAPEQEARFQREARAVARLQHPHIVQIYNVGEHEGLLYLSLEYVEGGSLADKVRREGLPQPRAAAEMVAKLARAVHHANEQGILHRDLKPSNILLTRDGQPKIADFGLARELASEEGLTHSGAIMGTPSYMSPEQAAGKVGEIGPAADIYSLGAILYQLLTGRPPFRGASIFETLSQLATEQVVPPHTRNPAVNPDLSAICLKCLEKDPQRRYPSANALAEDLERWLQGEPITARHVSK